jgi:hypothetical protein
MRYSVFSVNDHHPGLPRTVPELPTMHNFGALEPRLVERSMTLFAREVMAPIAAPR